MRMNLEQTQAELEAFKAEIYYPQVKPQANVQTLLQNLNDLSYIKKLSSIEISEYNVILSGYSLYLTEQENRLRSFINWCEANIKHIVGKNLDKTAFTWYQEKNEYIRSNEEHIIELEEKKTLAQTKLDQIIFISQKIQFIVDALRGLSFAKNKEMSLNA